MEVYPNIGGETKRIILDISLLRAIAKKKKEQLHNINFKCRICMFSN